VRVAVLERPGVVEIVERPTPSPGAGEVLVRIAAVGVCGSDVHYFTHGRIGRYVVDRPLVLGHECAGEIVEVGAGVSASRVMERVAVEPGVPCRRCGYCKTGRYNLCADVVFMATPPVDGAFAEFVSVPSDFAHPIPEHLSLLEAALVEPVAVGVHAARRGGIEPGVHCAVFGAGPIGLLLLQVLRAFGAASVAVADPQPARLKLAQELGADVVIDPSREQPSSPLATLRSTGVDVAFDASGSGEGLASTIQVAARGGRVVWIGLPGADLVPIPAAMLIDKEIDLRGVFRYANAYPVAIELVASGRVRTRPLISHRLPLGRTADALELLANRDPGVVKVVVEPMRHEPGPISNLAPRD
jgi:L-iditol 2-dehydrogenase